MISPRPARHGPAPRVAQVLLLCLLIASAVLGCGGRMRDVRGNDSVITDVELVGVTRFEKDELLDYLEIGESPILPWRPKEPYIEALLPIDAERIVQLYRAHGYYDAKVVSMLPETEPGRMRRVGKRKGQRRLGKTKIRVVVNEGAPTPVASVDVRWPEGPAKGPAAAAATPSKIAGEVSLKPGDTFEIPAFKQGQYDLREALRGRGYAFVAVDEAATVRPGEGVAVDYEVRPGPHVTIGEVTIDGLEKVPERYVRTEIEFAAGKRYSPALVDRVEKAVYAMGVFQSVTVEVVRRGPGEEIGEAPGDDAGEGSGAATVADLRIAVAEAPPQSVKVGPGIGVDPVRWEQRVQLRYRHKNLGKNLTRFELRALAGYAELPALYRPETHGPLFDLEPSFTQKGFLEKKTTWRLAPHFEVGIWEGYQFYSPELRMGPSRFFTKYLQLELTYNLRFVDFFNIDPALETSTSILGLDFRDPYLISYFEPRATIYLVDQILRPRNGAILSATYDIAGAGGDFAFHKIQPMVRGYWTPHDRVTLALRSSVGFIFPIGSERGGAPIDMNFYLGGADTVRGWGMRRLAPKILRGDCEMFSEACPGLPVGGQTMFFSNAEVRVKLAKNIGGVVFYDVGDVREGVRSFDPSMWAMSVGPGLRYTSPIGVFRLDVGFRINETDRSIGERGWALHLGLGEAF